MVIFLKTLGFGIWLVIMLVLIAAIRRTSHLTVKRVTQSKPGD
ncbi:MAG: hypothetical protein WAO57_04285 [Syntrophomonadaceae bacterium]|nr:hypothetical protein [Bacillota bacterium]